MTFPFPMMPVWTGKPSFFDTLKTLGLTSGLKLCLDAGSRRSYPGTGQSFLDLSGTGSNFYLGATSSPEASDPTFNGVPGHESSSEYFSVNGSQYFTIAGGNPSWVQNLHANNFLATFVGWIKLAAAPSSTDYAIFGTSPMIAADIGFMYEMYLNSFSSKINMSYYFNNGSSGTSHSLSYTSTNSYSSSSWLFFALSYNEGGGAGASFATVQDEAPYTFNGNNANANSGTATYPLQIFAGGNGQYPTKSGSQLAKTAIWSGVALTAAQVLSIFNATKSIYGY